MDYTPDPFPSGGGWTISAFTYGDSTQDSDVTDGVSDHDYNGSGNAYVYSFTVSNPNGSGEVCTGTIDVSYCGDGTIDGGNGEICDGEANCDVLTCECESGYSWDGDSCEVDATDAVCGTTHLSDIYDIDNNGDSLSGGSNNLCDAGTVANFVYAT